MNTSNASIIEVTRKHIEEQLYNEASGHDWWHVHRVWKAAKNIAKHYPEVDLLVIELASLLHDMADWKENKNDLNAGSLFAKKWLFQFELITDIQIQHICQIIENISFKGDSQISNRLSLEGEIVQDADRLDAMGAIGIARTFAYGGKKGQRMYDPNIPPNIYENEKEYIHNHDDNTALNHFYEKLLLLKGLMNTEYGKKVAKERHNFMKLFLDQFYDEFEGRK